jgi:hypothetical protein
LLLLGRNDFLILSLGFIEKKILDARNRRLNKRSKNSNTDEKLKFANERRSNLVKEFTSKTQKVVETKHQTAE